MNKNLPSELVNEPVSANNPAFIMYVEKALREGHSVIILLRYANMAGAKDYWLVRNAGDFYKAMAKLPAKTSISVFFEKVLPIKGVVSKDIEIQILDYLKAQTEPEREVFIMCLDASDVVLQFGKGIFVFETPEEVRTWISENSGASITAGGLPFWEVNSERVITGYIPDQDGVARRGAY